MSSPKLSSQIARDQQEPVGLVGPAVGQVTPLTPEQQKAMATRRKFLQLTVGGSLAAIGVAFAFPVLALKAITQFTDGVTEGDLIGDPGSNTPLDLAAFPVNTGARAGVLGKSTQLNENLLEVVRVGDAGTAEDFRVFNRICTHLGCPVQPELNAQNNVHCNCHGSIFSSQDGSVVHGPAARKLPSLPVSLDDQGRLTVAGEYNAPV